MPAHGHVVSAREALAVLLLLLSSIASHHLQSAEGCYDNERRALHAIRSDMSDPAGRWFSSWTGDDCCKWRGVACDNATGGHVTKLDLRYPFVDDDDNYYKRGVIKVNPSLLELKHLKYLDLSMNNFNHSSIPKAIASLVHLEYLNLSNAWFGGPIPSHLGNLSSLSILDLNRNGYENLYSHDLDWLYRIPSLKYLDMSFVDLCQAKAWLHQVNSIATLQVLLLANARLPSIPSPLPLFNLTSISMLDLSTYFYDGSGDDSLLRWISNSTNLECLYLHSCFSNLSTETVQLAIAALGNLKVLDLSYNNINGNFSRILRNASSRLEHLDLHSNSLRGDVPHILGNFRWLRYLSLWENQIDGEISPNIGNLVHLEYLDLYHNKISSGIPWSMGNLTNLVYLDLSGNSFFGGIPCSIGNLTSLVELDLSNNSIFGGIPWSIGNLTNLVYLDLNDNGISGVIPESFSDLYNLEQLRLFNNNISGEMPETFGKLINLKYLDISDNQLSGQIQIVHLYNLRLLDLSHNNIGGKLTYLFDGLSSNCPQGVQLSYLNLAGNNLSGIIPSSLGQFSLLEYLDLSSNSLLGNITEAHFSELVNLITLNISNNHFLNVILPDDWHPPFNISTIDMSFCNVRANLPYWIQSQSHLTKLYLSSVGLYGNLPTWFSDFILETSMEELILNSNNLSGPLPFTTTNLMDLSNNSFIGSIPFSYMNSSKTTILSLSYNNISGTILSSFCNLTSLRVLDLSRNHLHGEIPNCHGSLPFSLLSLHLSNNDFTGTLPTFLTHCRYLTTLDLGENKFYGEIPAAWLEGNLSSLKILRLRSNRLHGIIPVNLGNLTSVQVLDLSFNKLQGSIPSSIGKLSSMEEIQSGNLIHAIRNFSIFGRQDKRGCSTIYNCSGDNDDFYKERIIISAKGSTEEYTTVLSLVKSIDLSNNYLSGNIPEELTNLLGVCFLSLSNNHLMGRIPKNIGDMKQLMSLDLSVNNLTGAIPPSLADLNQLDHLNLSYNKLSGRIPKGNQLQTFADPSLFVGNKDLCGFPLPECPSDDAVPSDADNEGAGEDKLNTILEYTFIVVGFVVGFWISMGTLILKQSIRVSLFRSTDKLYDTIYVQLAMWLAKQAEAQD